MAANHVGRHKFSNGNWDITPGAEPNTVANTAEASLAVLMDIRHELQRLNDLLYCVNTIDIPRKLERIVQNTTKPKPRR